MLWKMGYNSNLTTGDVKKTYEKMGAIPEDVNWLALDFSNINL